MADFILKEDNSYLEKENKEELLLESSLVNDVNNYKFVSTDGDGISVTEKIK